jgi:hypothetical protein
MNMEKKMKEVMQNLKDQFGNVFDIPHKITPEMMSILLFEMSKQIHEAFH